MEPVNLAFVWLLSSMNVYACLCTGAAQVIEKKNQISSVYINPPAEQLLTHSGVT